MSFCFRTSSLGCLGLLFLACACQPVDTGTDLEPTARAEPAEPARSPKPIEAKAAPAVAPKQPAPPPVPAPAPVVDPALAAIIESAPDLLPWNRIVGFAEQHGSEPMLLRSDDGRVFAGVGPVLVRLQSDGSAEAVTLEGIEPMGDRPDLIDGDYYSYGTTTLGGAGPAGGFMVVEYELGARGQNPPAQTYRMDQGRWRRIASSPLFDSFPRGFGRWKDGSLLALRGFVPRYAHPAESEGEIVPKRELRAAAAAIAGQKQLVVVSGAPKAPALTWKGTAAAMASLPTGEVLIATASDDGASVLHYDATTGRQRVLPLPENLDRWDDSTRLVMRAPDDAWLWGPYIAHFDGKQWTRVDSPCVGQNPLLAVTADAEFLACSVNVGDEAQAAVLRRERTTGVAAGPWKSIGMPTAHRQMYVRTLVVVDERVLVLGEGDAGPASIWHTGPAPAKPFDFGDTAQISAPILAGAADLPITDGCRQIFVPFTAPTGTAHADAIARAGGDALPGDDAELVTVNVRGATLDGIAVAGLFGRDAAAAAEQITAALGDEVGTPTCNPRPRVAPPQ